MATPADTVGGWGGIAPQEAVRPATEKEKREAAGTPPAGGPIEWYLPGGQYYDPNAPSPQLPWWQPSEIEPWAIEGGGAEPGKITPYKPWEQAYIDWWRKNMPGWENATDEQIFEHALAQWQPRTRFKIAQKWAGYQLPAFDPTKSLAGQATALDLQTMWQNYLARNPDLSPEMRATLEALIFGMTTELSYPEYQSAGWGKLLQSLGIIDPAEIPKGSTAIDVFQEKYGLEALRALTALSWKSGEGPDFQDYLRYVLNTGQDPAQAMEQIITHLTTADYSGPERVYWWGQSGVQPTEFNPPSYREYEHYKQWVAATESSDLADPMIEIRLAWEAYNDGSATAEQISLIWQVMESGGLQAVGGAEPWVDVDLDYVEAALESRIRARDALASMNGGENVYRYAKLTEHLRPTGSVGTGYVPPGYEFTQGGATTPWFLETPKKRRGEGGQEEFGRGWAPSWTPPGEEGGE